MRIMGLDYGSVTVGVAISDELRITAQGIEVIRRERESKLRSTFARIEELVREYGVTLIVVGYPKKMDNTVGGSALKAAAFAEDVKRRTKLAVELWDERLTTVAAHRTLSESGISYKKKMRIVDKLAAVFILQGYLDYISAKDGSLILQEMDE